MYSATTKLPPHVVIDGFLQPDLHGRLLDGVLGGESRFEPTQVRAGAAGDVADTQIRQSWHARDGLGPLKDEFREALIVPLDAIREQLRIPPFKVARFELELAVHRDGGFYRPHIDIHTGDGRADTDRMLTMVYYFHRQPAGFTGGEIALYPLSRDGPKLIEPLDNRLVAFPAFALHEVRPIACPGDAWANARFSVNCWFNRRRSAQ